MQAIAIYYNIKSINKYLDLILIGEKWANVPLKGENGVILKEGKKITEVPVEMNERSGGVSSIRSWKNAYYMINVLLSIMIIGTRRSK